MPDVRPATLIVLAGFVGSLLLAACGSGPAAGFPEDSFALIANRDIARGASRVLIAVSDADGKRYGSPEVAVELTATPLDDPDRAQTRPGVFTWIVEDVAGLYRAEFDFERAGTWEVSVRAAAGTDPAPATLIVYEESLAPAVGRPAVSVPTPTLGEFTLEELTTDPSPDPAFYDLSLDEALANGRRTVLVFSTPAYCQTSACGPLLETVKGISPSFPEVDFIHVEVYTGLTEPDFAPDAAHLAPAAGPDYWNLPTEPWAFVIDGSGVVTARFEGVMGEDELLDALDS